MGKHLLSSRIASYNQKGLLVKIYKTAKAASEELGLFKRSVDKAIRNGSSLKGFYWRRYDDEKDILKKIDIDTTTEINNRKSISIMMLDDNDNIIKEYRSINEACIENKIDHKSIRDCLNHKQIHAGGYKWKKK